ncbi:unnamed protein product [Penicillium egyptiacum]|uniref:chitinase n=1 Tax=Penicillium egyptiacum TaxID=1303716 RepID=A0A9W4P1Z6_9EURO|nr:unnamed protein product [Penicillium egyptiacum]
MRASRLVLLSAASGLVSALSQFDRLKWNKNPCPSACDPSGDTSKWFTSHSVDEFAACNEPLLLKLNLYNLVDDDATHTTIRACTLGNAKSEVNFLAASGYVAPDALGATNFGPANYPPSSLQRRDDSSLTANEAACGAGPAIASSATVSRTQEESTKSPLSSKALEDAIPRVLSAGPPSLWIFPANNDTEPQRRSHLRDLHPRAECRYIRVEGGDTCPSLATRCGIGLTALKSFNKGIANFCDVVEPGQAVCCSSGTPPPVGPRPNADGSCKYHEVQQGEICDTIAAQYGITTADLFDLNKKTWGWDGCELPVGLRICVSNGNPPLPGSVWNADCGPTVPGTEAPKDGEELAELNPCPLDVCCNIWGKCGTTVDFCIPSKSSTGNPGTSAPGENGCIDNCGIEMVNNDDAPKEYRKVGYFEGWNYNRLFAVDNNLDGLDFDWEYPGATDIEGSEPGQEDDGENYLEFLKLVREKLPDDKSLSIATAASFWYLKGFPAKDMAPVVDYFIHMAYDLHGQWDVGREWSMEGCPAGNCLRSHINSTQTHGSLVMMTKAGVPSHKIVVGVTSYGRSFKMADATCRGPLCTYLGEGNDSPAKPGRCTETGGYISNYEINEIIEDGGAIKSWYDEETDSDYLVYDSVEWVAYMTDKTKDRRRDQYKGLNCGGTTDWAIDLQGEGRRARQGTRSIWTLLSARSPMPCANPPACSFFPPVSFPVNYSCS